MLTFGDSCSAACGWRAGRLPLDCRIASSASASMLRIFSLRLVLGLAASAAASRAAVDAVGPVQIDEHGIGTGSNDIEGDGDMEDVDVDADADALGRRVTIAFEGSHNGVPPRYVFAPQSVLLRTAF